MGSLVGIRDPGEGPAVLLISTAEYLGKGMRVFSCDEEVLLL